MIGKYWLACQAQINAGTRATRKNLACHQNAAGLRFSRRAGSGEFEICPRAAINRALHAIEFQCESGRGERIRTSDILLPKQARYRAALHPEGGIIPLPAMGSQTKDSDCAVCQVADAAGMPVPWGRAFQLSPPHPTKRNPMSTVRDVAVLVGSLRKESFNRKMALALAELVPPTLKLEIVEIRNLPLYNQDDDANPPPNSAAFKARIQKADAVLFVTPEYNRSVPGVLKNR